MLTQQQPMRYVMFTDPDADFAATYAQLPPEEIEADVARHTRGSTSIGPTSTAARSSAFRGMRAPCAAVTVA